MKKILAGILTLGIAGLVYAACAPDLIVTSVSYSGGTFSSVVQNRGTTATAGGVNITTVYTVDGVQRATGSVAGPLAAGASVAVGSTAYTIPDGTYTIIASVDSPTSLIAESQETNNQRSNIITVAAAPPSGPAAAFLGAQGGGAGSTGGRGGAVIMVTNLNNSGTGSLRDCVQATGARTCVFRVGGTIQLTSSLAVTNPFLTVAGHTAPGGGILISGKNMDQNVIYISTNNVIWRYTRIRKGWSSGCSDSNNSDCGATFYTAGGSYNVVSDHNSISWNQDEGVGAGKYSSSPVRNITNSWNLIAEGLSSHSTGILANCDGTLCDGMTDHDYHHNLIMSNSHRNPLLIGVKSVRLVNNITYNQYWYLVEAIGSGVQLDAIGNLYKRGPASTARPAVAHEILLNGAPTYLSGNIGWNQTNPAGDQWLMTSSVSGENGSENGVVPAGWKRASPLAATTYPIIAEPVTGLAASMTPIVGASRRLDCDGTWVANRDSVDTRLINQYNTNTGVTDIPGSETDVGGFPTIAAGTVCTDTDLDGMPNTWETAQGFNPNVYDPNLDSDGDGYTNLEEYLNGP